VEIAVRQSGSPQGVGCTGAWASELWAANRPLAVVFDQQDAQSGRRPPGWFLLSTTMLKVVHMSVRLPSNL